MNDYIKNTIPIVYDNKPGFYTAIFNPSGDFAACYAVDYQGNFINDLSKIEIYIPQNE